MPFPGGTSRRDALRARSEHDPAGHLNVNSTLAMDELTFCAGFEAAGARLVTLRNRLGSEASFTNYGARWVDLSLANPGGNPVRTVLGFDTLQGYMDAGEKYHGAIVGRVCGRMKGAAFSLGGHTYPLAANDAYGIPVKNHLHGGIHAFHNRFWKTELRRSTSGDESVVFSLLSPDGEEGYPGNLEVTATYTLLQDSNTVVLECRATTDRPTVVNLTNHAFFNPAGHSPRMSVARQRLTLASDRMVACDDQLLPTGELLPLAGSHADFSTGRSLAEAIASGDDRVRSDGGFTIAYLLDGMPASGSGLRHACRLEDPESGRWMELFTDRPSLQLYNGYFMDGRDHGHDGIPYFANAGVALEPQDYPDAPNHPEFPSVTITPEHPYRHRSEYVFGMRR